MAYLEEDLQVLLLEKQREPNFFIFPKSEHAFRRLRFHIVQYSFILDPTIPCYI